MLDEENRSAVFDYRRSSTQKKMAELNRFNQYKNDENTQTRESSLFLNALLNERIADL